MKELDTEFKHQLIVNVNGNSFYYYDDEIVDFIEVILKKCQPDKSIEIKLYSPPLNFTQIKELKWKIV